MGSQGAHLLRMPGISLAKGLPRPIYHRRALSNELLLRAVTGTSFFTKRDRSRQHVDNTDLVQYEAQIFAGLREDKNAVWSKNSNGLRWHNLRFPRFSSNRFR